MHPDVRIGWYPYVATKQTIVWNDPTYGKVLKVLDRGKSMGWQSVRNPSGGWLPPKRLPRTINGVEWAWVYTRSGSIQGWVRVPDIAPDTQSEYKPELKGPGGFDFEVGRGTPSEKNPSSCGRLSLTRPHRIVNVDDTYLRYSERGTSFHHMLRGTIVKLILVNAAHGYAFCEVIYVKPGSACLKGSRGFVSHNSLSPYINQ